MRQANGAPPVKQELGNEGRRAKPLETVRIKLGRSRVQSNAEEQPQSDETGGELEGSRQIPVIEVCLFCIVAPVILWESSASSRD